MKYDECHGREGGARGSGDVKAPQSLCLGESVTTRKIYLPWNYHPVESGILLIHLHFIVQHL